MPLKQNADDSLDGAPSVEKVVVLRRTGTADDQMVDGRDIWWHDLMEGQPMTCEPEPMDSEDMLFLLYTSGTTGKPKGIVHTSAGYLLGTHGDHQVGLRHQGGRHLLVHCRYRLGDRAQLHRLRPAGQRRDHGDVRGIAGLPGPGPVLGHRRQVRSDHPVHGAHGHPHLHALGRGLSADRHDMSSLRLMGTVGEPINPEAWVWYWQHIGGGRCPVVDTWWQTETGAMMIAPLPGLTTLKPGSATRPFPGIQAEILDADGNPVGLGGGGYLVVKQPWPSMLRGVYGDPERFVDTYWSRYEGIYFTADGARLDEDGYFWLLGRVDDVINVSGHRIGTMEVESALVDNQKVAEAACIGKDHEVKGQACRRLRHAQGRGGHFE